MQLVAMRVLSVMQHPAFAADGTTVVSNRAIGLRGAFRKRLQVGNAKPSTALATVCSPMSHALPPLLGVG